MGISGPKVCTFEGKFSDQKKISRQAIIYVWDNYHPATMLLLLINQLFHQCYRG